MFNYFIKHYESGLGSTDFEKMTSLNFAAYWLQKLYYGNGWTLI